MFGRAQQIQDGLTKKQDHFLSLFNAFAKFWSIRQNSFWALFVRCSQIHLPSRAEKS